MSTLNLLYKPQYAINEKIHIVIPSVGEVLDNEDEYYNLVSILTGMPIDFMVMLDDAGIDFSKINEYDLFLLLFSALKTQNTKLIFGELDLNNFEIEMNPQNNLAVLKDKKNDITIDRAIHGQIAAVLRKIHHLKKDNRKPGNEEARQYLLERARAKARKAKRTKDSQLEQLIIALVNTEQFKYDYEQTRGLSIYQFNESVRQIIHKVDYDNRMYGVYAGTIDAKKLSQSDLNWMAHK